MSHDLPSPTSIIASFFSELPDPRRDRNQRHKFEDLLTIALCATIAGAEHWTEVEEFGKEREEWFAEFLELPSGIPSHDTFNNLFRHLDPVAFEACFIEWTKYIADLTNGEVVAIDGKTIKGSADSPCDGSPIHMVSAYAAHNRLILGQVKTAEKSNEITAIPKLLEVLDLQNTVVTIDAMGCQKEIAKAIVDAEADYILALKGNHPELHHDVVTYFEDLENLDSPYECVDTLEGDHGRIEARRCTVSSDIDWLYQKGLWKGLKTIVRIESSRSSNGLDATETRYFISSLPPDPKRILADIRSHWGIENSVHWLLDVSYNEDACRVRKDHGAENLSVLRRIGLNLLKSESKCKLGIKSKRKKAGWSTKYLKSVLRSLSS